MNLDLSLSQNLLTKRDHELIMEIVQTAGCKIENIILNPEMSAYAIERYIEIMNSEGLHLTYEMTFDKDYIELVGPNHVNKIRSLLERSMVEKV